MLCIAPLQMTSSHQAPCVSLAPLASASGGACPQMQGVFLRLLPSVSVAEVLVELELELQLGVELELELGLEVGATSPTTRGSGGGGGGGHHEENCSHRWNPPFFLAPPIMGYQIQQFLPFFVRKVDVLRKQE